MRMLSVGFVTLLLSCGTAVNAALIDNGRTSYDSRTGLHWLDLTETVGLAPAITPGLDRYFADNWTIASGMQVDQFFREAGSRAFDGGVWFSRTSTVTDLLFDLLGVTYDIKDGVRLGGGWADNGSGVYSLPAYYENPPVDPYFTHGSNNVMPLRSDPNVGVYLVRAVPAPNAVWLVFLAGFLCYRLRHQH